MVNDMHISKSHGYLLNMFLNTLFISLMTIIEDIQISLYPHYSCHVTKNEKTKTKTEKKTEQFSHIL